jgi:hypothetical protein
MIVSIIDWFSCGFILKKSPRLKSEGNIVLKTYNHVANYNRSCIDHVSTMSLSR